MRKILSLCCVLLGGCLTGCIHGPGQGSRRLAFETPFGIWAIVDTIERDYSMVDTFDTPGWSLLNDIFEADSDADGEPDTSVPVEPKPEG